jgi:hypothetical protein
METFYVFQHALASITDGVYHSVEDILAERNFIDLVDPHSSGLIGDPCLFKLDQMAEGLIYGRLIADVDVEINGVGITEHTLYLEFPVAEYLFVIHNGPMVELSEVYDDIRAELDSRDLSAVYHPILVFPKGLPSSLKEDTTIEIWVATDANISDPEHRLSDDLQEALPRTKFNFYTW